MRGVSISFGMCSVRDAAGTYRITLYARGRGYRGKGVGDGVSALLVVTRYGLVVSGKGISPVGLCAEGRGICIALSVCNPDDDRPRRQP